MVRLFTLLSLILILAACRDHTVDNTLIRKPPVSSTDLTVYVNPLVGTGGHGHTFPGATLPFGMVQLSPDTRLDGWDGCSGYHYSDSRIYGFSHTHLSGTGVSDYGDILLMPTPQPVLHNGKDGYPADFSHDREQASAGYYRVLLDTDIEVELTATLRAGIHRYRFPSSENQYVILDLEHRDELLDFQMKKISDTVIEGHRHSRAWADDQRLFYRIEFSLPLKSETYNHQNPTVAAFEIDNPKNQPLIIKVGISAVDAEGARNNLRAETKGKSFDQLREEARNTWQKQLSKIQIQDTSATRKAIFYTALYHTMIAPNLYQDVDGRYRGMDHEIHQTTDFDYYTVFSLWDTYRATHPLFTIIEEARTQDFIKTMLAKYREGGIIPIWDLSACYTGCMIGYHGIPVIADGYLKGIDGFDHELALEAMVHSATRDHLGLKSYRESGFIPVEEESESVSKTLEYAYDDWCIARMAQAMGRDSLYQVFIKRAQSYKNLFDPSTGFMRGRFRNTWFGPFDPYEVNFNYTEANAWQYSLYVPQDISGHIELMGGKAAYQAHLDSLFSATNKTAGRHQADITGLIGQYAHGNEPSHHMAYLYNFVNRPDKTQEKVHRIMTELYTYTADGISGNEDCGQMSAWYVFSALGFYPVTPGSDQYIIGTPMVDEAVVRLENGNRFRVKRRGKGKYIAGVRLNGKEVKRSYLFHNEITEGGDLEYEMSEAPTDWGQNEAAAPRSSIDEHLILPPPFIAEGEVTFKGKNEITLGHVDSRAEIHYRFGEDDFEKYKGPFEINRDGKLSVFAVLGDQKSVELTTDFYEIDPQVSIELGSQYANEYSAGGNNALIDGLRGTKDFRTGAWQGYQGQDVIATVDLGRAKEVEAITTAFLQDQRTWIFLPTSVRIEVSEDGENWSLAGRKNFSSERDNEVRIENLEFRDLPRSIQKIRLTATTLGPLPPWHDGYNYNGQAWIFIDEISISDM